MIKHKRLNTIAAFPLYKLLPSIITIVAICAGLSAVKVAIDGEWERSVLLILVAAFLDGMDGRVARYLKAASDFGAELDSLADFCNFGLAPILVLYLWSAVEPNLNNVGWGIVLVFSVCMAIRLARFNINQKLPNKATSDDFFQGVPAPVGGMLVLLPLIVSFQFPSFMFFRVPWIIGLYVIVVALAMASRIPTFSIKKMAIPHDHVALFLAFMGMIVAMLLINIWLTVIVLSVVYALSIPVSVLIFYRRQV